jgi:hypothetical protein
VGGELRDHLVGVLLGDVQLVVLHGSWTEERHSTDQFNINLLKSCQDYHTLTQKSAINDIYTPTWNKQWNLGFLGVLSMLDW